MSTFNIEWEIAVFFDQGHILIIVATSIFSWVNGYENG